MRTALSLALLAIAAPAFADPAPTAKAPPTAAAQKTYAQQLRKGRQLEAAGKHADAIAAFQLGLQAIPDDSTLLGEIGAAAYAAKDLATAEAMTRKAIANAGAPDVRGATLYNLGRIQEDRKDVAGAVASYSASLLARPNGIVRARLTALDPRAAAALDPYKPVPLTGPFASIDAYCKTLPAIDGFDPDRCTCGAADTDKPAAVTAPYQQMQWFSDRCAQNDSLYADYKLGVKLAAGWYVASVAHGDVGHHCMSAGYTFDAAKPLSGQGARVLVSYDDDASCSNGSGDTSWSTVYQLIVGIGASKLPSATLPMLRAHHQTYAADYNDAHAKVVGDVALDYKWADDGTFTVTGKTVGIDPAEAPKLLGTHVIAFP
jgi:tetratricopeptide (TPR) repeat protein